jgi:uncharacterized protein YggU (UPF0235/DUF167 family)
MITKINVRVRANSSESKIEDFGDYKFLVYVKSPAEDNRANIEMLNLVAKHIGVPATKLKIVSGASSKDKTIEISY